MFRQDLLVLSVVFSCLTGCHHWQGRHPNGCHQPELQGCHKYDRHHRRCRVCGHRSEMPGWFVTPLFPGDDYGPCFQGNGCDECCGCAAAFNVCGTCQSCDAWTMMPQNSIGGCGCCSEGETTFPGDTCSGGDMQFNPITSQLSETPGCTCGPRQVPSNAPQQFFPQATTPESGDSRDSVKADGSPNPVPPVPKADGTSLDPDPPLPIDANPPLESAPASLPAVDPIGWRIPAMPPNSRYVPHSVQNKAAQLVEPIATTHPH